MFDFEGNKEVDSLDKVPEDCRSFYEEAEGGKFVLSQNASVQSAVKIISGQQKALTASRKEAANYKGKAVDLSSLSDYGETPEAIAEGFNAKIAEIQKEASKGKVDIEKVKASMEQAHEKKLKPWQDKVSSLSSQLETLLVKNVASEAIAAAKGSSKLLMPHIERQVRCVEETDSEGRVYHQVYVVDENGERRFSGTAGAEFMTIAELVSEMKADKEYGRMFDSDATRGGGTPPGHTRQLPQKGKKVSATDKISMGLGKGQFVRGGSKLSEQQ